HIGPIGYADRARWQESPPRQDWRSPSQRTAPSRPRWRSRGRVQASSALLSPSIGLGAIYHYASRDATSPPRYYRATPSGPRNRWREAPGRGAPRERMRGRVGLGGAPISRKSGAPHTITASI